MSPKVESESAPLLGTPSGAGEETAAAVDASVRGLIDTAFHNAVLILTANRALSEKTAALLLAKETLSAEELRAVAEQVSPMRRLPVKTGLTVAVG